MYRVKLSFNNEPVMVFAESIYHARQLALANYRDENGRRGTVQWIGKMHPRLING